MRFYDIPKEDFPFTIMFFDPDTGELLWEQTVDDAGILQVPSLGRPIHVVIALNDGTYAVYPQPKTHPVVISTESDYPN